MHNDIQKILLTEEQIQTRIKELGEILTAEYADKNPVIVGVLKGVVIFYADMIRQIKVPCQMDFMWISSYSGTHSTGNMMVRQDLSPPSTVFISPVPATASVTRCTWNASVSPARP